MRSIEAADSYGTDRARLCSLTEISRFDLSLNCSETLTVVPTTFDIGLPAPDVPMMDLSEAYVIVPGLSQHCSEFEPAAVVAGWLDLAVHV